MEIGDFIDTLPEEVTRRDPVLRFIKLGLLRLEPHPDLPGVFSVYANMTGEEMVEAVQKDDYKRLCLEKVA